MKIYIAESEHDRSWGYIDKLIIIAETKKDALAKAQLYRDQMGPDAWKLSNIKEVDPDEYNKTTVICVDGYDG